MNRSEVQPLGRLNVVGSGPRLSRVAEAESIEEMVCRAEHCVVSWLGFASFGVSVVTAD